MHTGWRNYHNLYFTTATILNWQRLLKADKYKYLIADSLRYLVEDGRVRVYGFVIMPNHIHLLWEVIEPHTLSQVQQSLLRFTAQKMKMDLTANHPKVLEYFKVNKKDRMYQFWKRRPLSIEIITENVFWQKLNYIHNNPCTERWKLAKYPQDYIFSSAEYYMDNRKNWDFLA